MHGIMEIMHFIFLEKEVCSRHEDVIFFNCWICIYNVMEDVSESKLGDFVTLLMKYCI